MVRSELFGELNGKKVYLLTLTNKDGNVVKLTNFGAKINWIEVPDKYGKKENITFGYDTFEKTLKGEKSFGSVIGRYANRIAKGKFTIGDTTYSLALNDGTNSLHGGPGGWHSVVWDTEVLNDSVTPTVKFTYLSPDGEEGFPGTMNIQVVYTWTDRNEIIIAYKCTTDKPTVLNITNHAYFNLHGAGNGDILDHELTLNASSFTPVDKDMNPTGEIRKVKGTPFDFTSPYIIGDRIGDDDEQLIISRGYDHNYILDHDKDVDAILYDPVSGRMMEIVSDQPGIQLYTGNFLDGSAMGHGGKKYTFRSGVCLETGHFPDSPNHKNFPTTELKPGETFRSTTTYRFSAK